jgi:hypothetical protein
VHLRRHVRRQVLDVGVQGRYGGGHVGAWHSPADHRLASLHC